MDATARVRAAYARIAEVDRPDIWISLRSRERALIDAAAVERRLAAGELLPLAGRALVVKDNIDVAGMPTTAACPAFAYEPEYSAVAVQRLTHAGAVLIGKTNMDQFATGLVGTRSPYGAVRDARRPAYISGGSSSGSAVAVALGIADIALGTDTAGSGRVPAAFAGVIGIKPTRGLVPIAGVVPACRSLDCVSVFSATVSEAERALDAIAGTHPRDPRSRAWPADAPLAASPTPCIAVPAQDALDDLSQDARAAFAAVRARLAASGATVLEVNIASYLATGQLLYEGAFVAERYAAVGGFIDDHYHEVDATVASIITAARDIPAHALVRDQARVDELRRAMTEQLAGTDALLLPTTTRQPTLAAVRADPIGTNQRLGRYTNAANLLDMCAVAIPASEADGGCFGVSLIGPAFADKVLADLARRLTGDHALRPRDLISMSGASDRTSSPIDLLVVGAHLTGQPLNTQLTDRGATLVGPVATAPRYRLYALDTTPPKPGLVQAADGDPGSPIRGELWRLPPAGLASLLAALPTPMTLGRVTLADATEVVGFLCEPAALATATDITSFEGWLAYLASRGVRP